MKNKEVKPISETVLLGEVSPKQRGSMLAYTVNISPKDKIPGRPGEWGTWTPDEQVQYLRRLHYKVFIENYKLLEIHDDNLYHNQVNFEFTKAGEVHSHGYFLLKEKYGGYKRYIITITKSLKSMLPKSYYNVVCKWAEEPETWLKYMVKEVTESGYGSYSCFYKEEEAKNILHFIGIMDKRATEEK